jgi:uncharacterized protein YutD
MKVDYKDFQGNCPMTVENIKKYNIKDSYIKRFCGYGCSPICNEVLIQHIERSGKKNETSKNRNN